MEIEKQVFSLFYDFLRDLGKTYPEIKSNLNRNYEDVLTENEDKKIDDFPKLKLFLDLIYEHKDLIREKDENFFELEIELLENISFKNLWSKNISNKTKGTIWKYLQTFSLITINLKSSEELQNALSNIKNDDISKEDLKDKELVNDLKEIKKLTDDVKGGKDDDEFDLEKMMGGLMDSSIGNVAKEVAETMDVENMFGDIDENSNPMEVMAKLMNPEKMGSIFQNIDTIMKGKMESGELSEDKLKEEAEGMVGKMNDNPLFGNLMKQMNSGMENNQTVKEEDKEEKLNKREMELNKREKELEEREKNREKLKKKIKEKKEKRTN